MQPYQAIILGLIEGLTEFIPVSSTFHLIFASQLLGLEANGFLKFFEVFIQAGAILAVVWLYGRELWADRRLQKLLALSLVPTAAAGILLHRIIKEDFFTNNNLMLTAFLLVGLLFVLIEYWQRHRTFTGQLKQLDSKQAVLIGLAQALAVIPGVSRSGVVIVAMMLLGQSRSEAAKYSFLLALPTIVGAALFDLWKTQSEASLNIEEVQLLAIGSAAAFCSALLVLRWFIKFLSRHSLSAFGIYRLLLGLYLWQLLW